MTPLPFDTITRRIRRSRDPAERRGLFVGRTLYGGVPVLIGDRHQAEHVIIRGGPGTGKSQLLLRHVAQVIRRQAPGYRAWLVANGFDDRPANVVFFDMKGDLAQLHAVKEEADRAEMAFKVVTTECGAPTNLFLGLDQSHLGEMTVTQHTQDLLQGLGTSYGTDFFTSVVELVALQVVAAGEPVNTPRAFHKALSDPTRFAAVLRRAAEGLPPENLLGRAKVMLSDARHLLAVLERLRFVHALNVTPADTPDWEAVHAHRVDLPALFRPGVREVVYFFLPYQRGETECPAVARLALLALASAGGRPGARPATDVVAVVDEFHTVMSRHVEPLLAQGRERCRYVLAHQFHGQGRSPRLPDFADLLHHCVGTHFDFEASDEFAVRRIQALGLAAEYAALAWPQRTDTVTDFRADGAFSPERSVADGYTEATVSTYKAPLWDEATVKRVSAERHLGWVYTRQHQDYTRFSCPTPFVWDFHLPLADKERRDRLGWPAPGPGQFAVERDPFRRARRSAPAPDESPDDADDTPPTRDIIADYLRGDD